MKKITSIIFILIGALWSCSEDTIDLVGVGSITGRVVEATSFDPIENAKITLSNTSNTVFSDADGYFVFEEVETGDYSVSATKEGYLQSFEAATVETDLTTNVIFEMQDDNSLNKPPLKPILITPADGAEEQDVDVEFIWTSADGDEDELEYTLKIRNNVNNDIISVEELTDTIYMIENLKYGVKYFWQVSVTDNINPEVISEISSFTTVGDPLNRYLYVKEMANGNSAIFSSSVNDETGEEENSIQLTQDSKSSWRPRKNNQANLIAFLQNYNNQTHIFTMEPDGTDVKQVTSAVPVAGFNLNEIDFSWSTNGEKIAYPYFDKLYVINKDGSGLQQIFQTPDGNYITEIQWSYNGDFMALKTNNSQGYNASIYTIDVNGNVLNNILFNVDGAMGGLDLSVDDKYLLFTKDDSGFQDASYRQLNTNMYIYSFQFNTLTNISTNKPDGYNDLDPRFSPNESEVIFVQTSNDGLSQNEIYKVAIDSNQDRTLLFQDAKMPDWE